MHHGELVVSLRRLFRLGFYPGILYKEFKIDCDRKKLFDTHVRVSGNLDKVKSIKSQNPIRCIFLVTESSALDGKQVWSREG